MSFSRSVSQPLLSFTGAGSVSLLKAPPCPPSRSRARTLRRAPALPPPARGRLLMKPLLRGIPPQAASHPLLRKWADHRDPPPQLRGSTMFRIPGAVRPVQAVSPVPGLVDSEEEWKTYTVDEALTSMRFGRFQWLLLGYTGLAWAAEAMELLLLSFIGPAAAREWGLDPSLEATLSSVVFAGMLFGAYGSGLLADAKGRRFGFSVTAVVTFFFGLASALSPSFGTLLLFRAVVGAGLGGAPVVFALFMEFVPTAERGFWLIAVSLFWSAGSVLEAGLAWALLDSWGWRWLVAFSTLPFLVVLLFYPFLPESPRFLLAKGRHSEALNILRDVSSLNQRALPEGRLVRSRDVAPKEDSPGASTSTLAAAQRREEVPPGRGKRPLLSHAEGEADRAREGPHGEEASSSGEAAFPLLSPSSSSSSSSSSSAGAKDASASVPSAPAGSLALGSGQGPGRKGEREATLEDGLLPSAAEGLIPKPSGGVTTKGSKLLLLFSSPLRTSTILLWTVLFACAFSYYGFVLLTTQLSSSLGQNCSSASDAAAGGAAAGEAVAYKDILLASVGELPGLLAAALLVDRLGRKHTIFVLLFCTGLCSLGLLGLVELWSPDLVGTWMSYLHLSLPSSLLSSTPLADVHNKEALLVLLLFLARASIMGAFQTSYTYAPEVYPTTMRTTGFGAASAFARLGGIACPYVAVGLLKQCEPGLALGLFAVVPLIASAAALAFPVETSQQGLLESVNEIELEARDGE